MSLGPFIHLPPKLKRTNDVCEREWSELEKMMKMTSEVKEK